MSLEKWTLQSIVKSPAGRGTGMCGVNRPEPIRTETGEAWTV